MQPVPYVPQPVWFYYVPFLMVGATILFGALNVVALWRIGTFIRRFLFHIERSARAARVEKIMVEPTEPPTGFVDTGI